MEIAQALRQQTDDAKALLSTYADILADDEQARADLVEGETDLHTVIEKGLARVAELEALTEGLDALHKRVKSRMGRLEDQAAMLRTLIGSAMEIGGIKKLELPLGTVTLKATPPAVRVTDESQIPTQFWKTAAPTLDKRALLAALKEGGAYIPGAELSNGGMTVQIKLT